MNDEKFVIAIDFSRSIKRIITKVIYFYDIRGFHGLLLSPWISIRGRGIISSTRPNPATIHYSLSRRDIKEMHYLYQDC